MNLTPEEKAERLCDSLHVEVAIFIVDEVISALNTAQCPKRIGTQHPDGSNYQLIGGTDYWDQVKNELTENLEGLK